MFLFTRIPRFKVLKAFRSPFWKYRMGFQLEVIGQEYQLEKYAAPLNEKD